MMLLRRLLPRSCLAGYERSYEGVDDYDESNPWNFPSPVMALDSCDITNDDDKEEEHRRSKSSTDDDAITNNIDDTNNNHKTNNIHNHRLAVACHDGTIRIITYWLQ